MPKWRPRWIDNIVFNITNITFNVPQLEITEFFLWMNEVKFCYQHQFILLSLHGTKDRKIMENYGKIIFSRWPKVDDLLRVQANDLMSCVCELKRMQYRLMWFCKVLICLGFSRMFQRLLLIIDQFVDVSFLGLVFFFVNIVYSSCSQLCIKSFNLVAMIVVNDFPFRTSTLIYQPFE